MDTLKSVKKTSEQPKQSIGEHPQEQLPARETVAEVTSSPEHAPPKAEAVSGLSGAPSVIPSEVPEAIMPDERKKKIDRILEDGLRDAYAALPDDIKSKFVDKGDEVSEKIRTMIDAGAVVVKKIIEWIREWLQMIPGVNRYYLEQEAKIKADRILFIVEEERGERTE